MINGHGDDIHNYDHVRINFSSNIYGGFSHQGLFEHLKASMHLITRYPEPSPLSLEKRLAEFHGIDSEEIMVTNGATEAIYLVARAFLDHEAVIPQPTFAEYADACMDNHGSKHMWWLCNPNNPTGHVVPKQELLDKITAHPDDIFVIDASYAAYTQMETLSATEIVSHDNVIMLHSMTKDYGVPGIRLGYIIANRQLLQRISGHRMPWSVNALAIEAGKYLLDHRAEYTLPLASLIAERKRMEGEMLAIGITTSPSDSNMLLCFLPRGTASELKDYLARNHGILIRDASNFNTLTPRHFRVAVQSASQNDQLINALKQWI